MVSDIAPHPDHQMLSLTKVIKHEVPSLCLIDIFTHKASVFLHHLNRPIEAPFRKIFFLLRRQLNLWGQEHGRDRIRFLPE